MHAMVNTGIEETAESDAQMHADALLQASRRVDWRFLLPDPHLGQVAYVGPRQGTLLEALQLFSDALTVIESPCGPDDLTPYDLVVVSRPSYEILRWALGLVKTGGCLYIEAHGGFRLDRLPWRNGRWSRAKEGRLRSAADYVAMIKQFGSVEVEAYWHWPDFESCTKIIPLADQMALRYAIEWRQGGASGWLKAVAGRWVLKSGLLSWMVPCFSIVVHQRDLEVNVDQHTGLTV